MERHNLFQFALENADRMTERHKTLMSTCKPEAAVQLNAFTDLIQNESGISINMNPAKMQDFLDQGRYLSAHERARKDAAEKGRTPGEVMRERQKEHYERRMAFDSSFVSGESFLYGALNMGGPGVEDEKYGGLCAFFRSPVFHQGLECAFVPGNSLDLYMPPEHCPELQVEKLREDIAAFPERQYLAALKHQNDIPTTPEYDWAIKLCSKNCFVEAIFVGHLAPKDMGEVRLSRAESKKYADLMLDEIRGTLLQADKDNLDAYTVCIKKLQALGIRIEEV